jgi:hypothetical protein
LGITSYYHKFRIISNLNSQKMVTKSLPRKDLYNKKFFIYKNTALISFGQCPYHLYLIYYSSDSVYFTVIVFRNDNALTGISRLYNLVITNIHRYMIHLAAAVGIEHQVTRLTITDIYSSACTICLISGYSREIITKVFINCLNKSGTVSSLCQAFPTPYIRVTDKL